MNTNDYENRHGLHPEVPAEATATKMPTDLYAAKLNMAIGALTVLATGLADTLYLPGYGLESRSIMAQQLLSRAIAEVIEEAE